MVEYESVTTTAEKKFFFCSIQFVPIASHHFTKGLYVRETCPSITQCVGVSSGRVTSPTEFFRIAVMFANNMWVTVVLKCEKKLKKNKTLPSLKKMISQVDKNTISQRML